MGTPNGTGALTAFRLPAAAFLRSGWPDLDQPNPRRFKPFPALDHIDNDGLPFGETREPRSFKSGDMDEHVLVATVEGNEAVASLGVEPFHCAGLLDRCIRRCPVGCRRPEIRSPWCRRLSSAPIDADDLGGVWSLVTRTDADFEHFTRLHDVDAALSQHAPVEEGVAGPIREFNKPEAFVGVEPLDDPVDRGTGRVFERLAEPGSGSERAGGLRLVRVGVELATRQMTKILISQL